MIPKMTAPRSGWYRFSEKIIVQQAVYPNLVTRTHQPGFAARKLPAAALAAERETNSPKQVAPEPDMRAT
jgi:hypothetical protein